MIRKTIISISSYLKQVFKLSDTGRLRTISYFLSDEPGGGPYSTMAPSRCRIGRLPNESVLISTTLAGVASPPNKRCNTKTNRKWKKEKEPRVHVNGVMIIIIEE